MAERIAVLSDIHSNFAAFSACLAKMRTLDIDGVVLLGDTLTDCPYPQKTMQMIYALAKQYPFWPVPGNREELLLQYGQGKIDHEWTYCSQTGSLLYTFENLTPTDFAFFEELPKTRTLCIGENPPLTLCHGSPRKINEPLKPERLNTHEVMADLDTEYLLCGHTHRQYMYEYNGKTLINPGSVGTAVNGRTDAQFAVLTSSKAGWTPEFFGVEYDKTELFTAFESSGLAQKAPVWAGALQKLLLTGRNYNMECAALAAKLSEADGENPRFPPEIYWERAAGILKIQI